jgi:general secretion pathway protein L
MSRTGPFLMLGEIADWWVGQMRTLIPAGWFPASRQPDALIVVIDRLEDGERLNGYAVLRRNGEESAIGSLDQDRPALAEPRLATGLRLPRDAVLTRELVLPLAAARDLAAVIGFEMDRFTPFAAEELYWGVSGLKRDRTRGKLSLQLSFVLRAQVEALRQALARIRLAPSFIEAEHGRIDLETAPKRADRWLQTGLSALCGVLALACLASPFLRQQMALDAVAQTIAERAPAASKALALRQQLAVAASGRAAIAQARRAGDALQVLATLTDALPDGTWLSDLTLKSGDLTFDGQSTDAARLIGLLSAVPGLRDPSFTAPVTRTADGTADQFSLHASVSE